MTSPEGLQRAGFSMRQPIHGFAYLFTSARLHALFQVPPVLCGLVGEPKWVLERHVSVVGNDAKDLHAWFGSAEHTRR